MKQIQLLPDWMYHQGFRPLDVVADLKWDAPLHGSARKPANDARQGGVGRRYSLVHRTLPGPDCTACR